MSGRPKTRSAGQIIEDAKTLLELPQIERLPRVTGLLAESRACSETSFDEILRTAGYEDITEYWNVALSCQMPVSRYAGILALHSRDRSFTGYSRAYHQIHEALKTAGKEGRQWISGPYLHDLYEDGDFRSFDVNEDGWRGMVLMPREATEWFLFNKMYEGLIPASLRELLKPEINTAPKHKGGRGKLDFTKRFEQWFSELSNEDRQLSGSALEASFISTYPMYKKHKGYLRRLVPDLKKRVTG